MQLKVLYFDFDDKTNLYRIRFRIIEMCKCINFRALIIIEILLITGEGWRCTRFSFDKPDNREQITKNLYTISEITINHIYIYTLSTDKNNNSKLLINAGSKINIIS